MLMDAMKSKFAAEESATAEKYTNFDSGSK
jgi:hypothetical protein